MGEVIEQFINYLDNVKDMSENTIQSYKRDLLKMKAYFDKQEIYDVKKINSSSVNGYLMRLERENVSQATIFRYRASMRAFFHYLFQRGIIDKEPEINVITMAKDKKNPSVLSVEQVDRLLAMPSSDTPKEVRDKAMLELLYATGMRVSELINLKLEDVNMELGYVVCREKNKERVVPFGISAKKSLEVYLCDFRNMLTKDNESDYLFVNFQGNAMSRQGFWKIIKKYGRDAEIEETITPHTLRHSFALHLLENGADIKAVQEMMGHSVISTTQQYMSIKNTKIRDEYMKAHPRK